MTDDLLFSPGTTHILVKCWSCGREVTRTAVQVPKDISSHKFEQRSVCACGVNWPHVTKYPKKKTTSM